MKMQTKEQFIEQLHTDILQRIKQCNLGPRMSNIAYTAYNAGMLGLARSMEGEGCFVSLIMEMLQTSPDGPYDADDLIFAGFIIGVDWEFVVQLTMRLQNFKDLFHRSN